MSAGGHLEPGAAKEKAHIWIAGRAKRIATDAHRDQTDKAGQPYIGHVERVVANLIRMFPDATDDEIAAAWLHDVIEDTVFDANALYGEGVPLEVIDIVQELSRPLGTSYLEWIARLADHASPSAVRVKLADNADNSDTARVAAIPNGAHMLRTRYEPARQMLEARLLRDVA